MPSLDFELQQLAVANRHVQVAQEAVVRMRDNIEREPSQSAGSVEEHRALQVALDSLGAFIRHRDLITRTIDDIRAGRLPDTGNR